ncbi:ATP-binding protein [Pelomonas aquatica]|jgi:DNA-binding CsgD family transcriptional regulator|nr:AAA family ATPase [Pelomonas aquatica]MCY4755551.1 AAA family ATPase [Pelomonas aquatica]
MELLERAEALEQAQASLTRARAGRGGVLLLSGEAGIGKTSVVAALATQAVGLTGLRLLRGGCEDLGSARPLGPLHEMARGLAHGEAAGALLALLAGNAPAGEVGAALVELLDDAHDPSLLVFEDLHWADEATLDLIKHLGRRIAQLPALLLLSYRSDEVHAEHPLGRLLGDLPASCCTRLALAPLSVGAVATLCTAAGRPASTAPALHAATAGNPFFVTEVLASGVVDLDPGAPAAVPSGVRDAVLTRIRRLAPELREVLSTLCVVPGGASLALAQALLPDAAPAVDDCIARGLLVARGELLAFRHELARLAVADLLAPMQRRSRHAAVLQALRGRVSGEATLARLAHHASAAGDAAAVLEFAPAAAAQAAAVGAHRQAALLLAMALRVADAAPLALRAQLHESWSYEAGLALRIDAEVVQARHRALALWRQLGRIDKIGLNLRWLSRLHWYQGDAAEAERYAAEAVEVLQAHPPGAELAWAYATRAQLHMLRDRVEPARLWGERAMSLARRLGEREVLCHALNSVGTATLFAGHAEGAALLERSLALARESGFHEQAARAYSNIAEHAVVSKDFARAEVWLAEGIAFNRRFDLDAWRPYLVGWQAQLRLEQGRYEEALAIAAEVLAMSRLTTIMKLPALTVRAWTLLRCGAPEARGVLDEALAIARPTREGHRILPLLQAQAESRWLAGDEAGAAAALQTLGELPEQQSSPWAAGALATWLRRCGRSAALPARPAEPWALELAGRPDLAAEAWARLGLPFEAGVARLQQALAGDAPEAALADAQRLLAPLGAAPALARLQVLARRHGLALQRRRGPYARSRQHPNGLTGREQQVLALLAEGRANADIAGRLGLSLRTVEHHVSAVLAKLGTEGRAEAIAKAWREGLVPGAAQR